MPRKVRLKAIQKMEEAKDSLVKYNYLAMTLKTYLITSQLDSAQIVIQQIHDFIERQHSSSQMADLESECFNMKGNIFARVGNMDSAEICFRKAYELRMRGTRIEVVGVVHERCGKDFLTVTPGVRFADGDAGDQKRVTTPARAKELGSDYIVVGRPITQAEDPVAAYRRCREEFIG